MQTEAPNAVALQTPERVDMTRATASTTRLPEYATDFARVVQNDLSAIAELSSQRSAPQ